MIRMTIAINENRHQELRFIAYQKATSISKLVQEAIDIYLKEKRYGKVVKHEKPTK